jgi:hypothetical protein
MLVSHFKKKKLCKMVRLKFKFKINVRMSLERVLNILPPFLFVCCFRTKKTKLRKYIFALYFPIIPSFFFLIYYTLISIHQKNPIFLNTLYLFKILNKKN